MHNARMHRCVRAYAYMLLYTAQIIRLNDADALSSAKPGVCRLKKACRKKSPLQIFTNFTHRSESFTSLTILARQQEFWYHSWFCTSNR